jgi:hypothetical protein
MRLPLKIAAVLVVGTVLGVLTTWLMVFRSVPGRVSDGPWKTNLSTGSTQSDPYKRASVAIHGLFALNRSEAVYYSAAVDRDGHQLDGHCRYEIAGRDPEARWWSITAYGMHDYFIPNPAHRYSVSKTVIMRNPNGTFAVRVGGTSSGDNWIPVGPGRFSLTLRLYNPGPAVLADPTRAVLPALKRLSCS